MGPKRYHTNEPLRLSEANLPDDILQIALSHGPPTDSERELVSSAKTRYVHNLQSHITEMQDFQLPKYDGVLSDMHTEAHVTRKRIQVCDSLLSSLRKLPLEIMGEIFWHCTRQIPEVTDGDGRKSIPRWEVPRHTEPTTLSQVSQFWRLAALSTPAIWSPLSLRAWEHAGKSFVSRQHSPGIYKHMDKLGSFLWSLQLFSSGAYYLTTDSTTNEEDTRKFECRMDPIGRVFEHPSFRTLKKLQLHVDHNEKDITFRGITLPNVDSLLLRWSRFSSLGFGRRQDEETNSPYLPHLPNLTKAIISSFPESFFSFQCEKLTHIYIGAEMSTTAWLETMKRCVALQRGSFHIEVGDSEEETNHQAALAEIVALPQNPDTPAPSNPVSPSSDLLSQSPIIAGPIVIDQPELSELTILTKHHFNPRGVHFTWPALRKFKLAFNDWSMSGWAISGSLDETPWDSSAVATNSELLSPVSILEAPLELPVVQNDSNFLSALSALKTLTLIDTDLHNFRMSIAPVLEAASPWLESLFLHVKTNEFMLLKYLGLDERRKRFGLGASFPSLKSLGIFLHLWQIHDEDIEMDELEKMADSVVALVESASATRRYGDQATTQTKQPGLRELGQISQLENLVIRIEDCEGAKELMDFLERKFRALKIRRSTTRDMRKQLGLDVTSQGLGVATKVGITIAEWSEAALPIPPGDQGCLWKHWDDGFLDFTENPSTPFSPIPRSGHHSFTIIV